MRVHHRLRRSLIALAAIFVVGTTGYTLLGFGVLEAMYQTVTTVSTVGFREVRPLRGAGQVFTMVLIVAGVGAALFTFSSTFQWLVEGELHHTRRRMRMDRNIAQLSDHVIVCGWGRVGKAIASAIAADAVPVVVVDHDAERLAQLGHLYVVGDATNDDVLLQAGIERAKALVAAIDTDAENLYVTLSGRSLRPDMFIIARARDDSSLSKLLRAGADRVVNPQAIGGARIAAFVNQPHVAEFLDVVMHEGQVEYRLEEVTVPASSPMAGATLRDAAIRERSGALILAMRNGDGEFITNPAPETIVSPSHVLIAIGTSAQLAALGEMVRAG